jgi:alpha-ribazole phosphatase
VTLPATTELLLIRHAPALTGGRMAGRRDVAADCSDSAGIAGLRAAVGRVDHLVISPALRCRQTAAAVWPDLAPVTDARLWEQDFGAWEGLPFSDLPDLGPLSLSDLAAHCPPQGESFAMLCDRVYPGLRAAAALGGRVAVVAHAGTVRAALAQACGFGPSGLAFQVAPLSLTRIIGVVDGPWSVASVNVVSG